MAQALQYNTGTIEKPPTVGLNSQIKTKTLKIEGQCEIGENVRILANELSIGSNTRIENNVVIKGKNAYLGKGVRIRSGANILSQQITVGANTEIGENAKITALEKFKIGRDGIIAKNSRLSARSLEIGNFFYSDENPIPMIVGGGGWRRPTAKVRIGSACVIHDSFINACMSVEIGNNVGFSARTAVITHGFWNSVILGYSTKFGPVTIGNNVIIGYGAIILPSVTVGDYCSIAAGAVVTKNFPPNCVLGGVPAKMIQRGRGYQRQLTLQERTRITEGLLKEYTALLQDKLDDVNISREKGRGLVIHGKYLDKEFEVVFSPSLKPKVRERNGRRILLSFESVQALEGDFAINLLDSSWNGVDDVVSDDLRDFLRHHGVRILSRRFRSIPPKLEKELADM